METKSNSRSWVNELEAMILDNSICEANYKDVVQFITDRFTDNGQDIELDYYDDVFDTEYIETVLDDEE